MKRFNKLSKIKFFPSFKLLAKEEQRHVKSLSRSDIKMRMKRINHDFRHAFELLKEHRDTVTFFGSARFKPGNRYYDASRELARRLVKEHDLTIVSGGGRGIMEAANQGAAEAKGNSIGLTIELPFEQVTNDFVTHSVDFYYFFSRKVALAFTARAYVYFPGGFGTLDEFFEMMTLKQTGKIKPIPIILFGSEYWRPLAGYIEEILYRQNHTIEQTDLDLFVLTDSIDEVVDIISSQKD